jgi:hypothetical protein
MYALDFGDGVTMSEALSTSNTAELGLWSQVRRALINAENGFEYVKELSVLRLPGILIAVSSNIFRCAITGSQRSQRKIGLVQSPQRLFQRE